MKKNEYILDSIIKECYKHQRRLQYAFNKLKSLFPFTSDKLSNLTDDEIAILDQLIYRFTKLQDAIGNKLFKCVLILLDEEIINKSQIDIFNRLEQLEIVNDYDKWKSLRDLRNELAYEYDEYDIETVEKLNLLFTKIPELESYLNDILNYLNNKGLYKIINKSKI